MPPCIATRSAKVCSACLASRYWTLSETASRMIVSISGRRLSASRRVNRLGIWPSDARNLHRHGAASRTVEFGQNDALPGAQQHAGVAHLQGKRLAHDHSAQVRVRVLTLAIGIARIV